MLDKLYNTYQLWLLIKYKRDQEIEVMSEDKAYDITLTVLFI